MAPFQHERIWSRPFDVVFLALDGVSEREAFRFKLLSPSGDPGGELLSASGCEGAASFSVSDTANMSSSMTTAKRIKWCFHYQSFAFLRKESD